LNCANTSSGDRSFFFDVIPGPIRSVGAPPWELEWTVVAIVRLSATGRSLTALNTALVEESKLLRLAIEGRAAWPAGVVEVVFDPPVRGRDESGDLVLQFPARALVLEDS
jgi:hypothetical protein